MFKTIKQAWAAVSLLSPAEIRERAGRQVNIGLVAGDEQAYRELEEFLAPASLAGLRSDLLKTVHRATDANGPSEVDFVLYGHGVPCPRGAFLYRSCEEESTIAEILDAHEELGLALACKYPAFRKPVVDRIIQAVARENALFAVASALPNVVPNLFELPWAFGEFASDTIFLTVNQMRMAMLIAAAYGAEVGFTTQKTQMLPIAAGAFGWRAIARELAGKIPLGGGLIPKGAIAYAATYAIGKGLDAYHRSNLPYTREQHEAAYREALERGKTAAESVARQAG